MASVVQQQHARPGCKSRIFPMYAGLVLLGIVLVQYYQTLLRPYMEWMVKDSQDVFLAPTQTLESIDWEVVSADSNNDDTSYNFDNGNGNGNGNSNSNSNRNITRNRNGKDAHDPMTTDTGNPGSRSRSGSRSGSGSGNAVPNPTNASPTRSNDSNHSKRRRPWMVLHVGPPKTATTTIQDGLASWPILEILAREDNVYFMGQQKGAIRSYLLDDDNGNGNGKGNGNGNGRSNLTRTVTTFPIMEILRPGINQKTEESPFARAVKHHFRAGQNVVISSEHFTSHYSPVHPNGKVRLDTIFRQASEEYGIINTETSGDRIPRWSELTEYPPRRYGETNTKHAKKGGQRQQQQQQQRRRRRLTTQRRRRLWRNAKNNATQPITTTAYPFGFDVTVVVTYRHMFQWLPSQHYQNYLAAGGNFYNMANKLDTPRALTPDDYINDYKHIPGVAEFIEDYLSDDDGDGGGDGDGVSKEGNDDNIHQSNKDTGDGNDGTRDRQWVNRSARTYRRRSGSLHAYQAWSSVPELRDRVRVFDLHQQRATLLEDQTSDDASSNDTLPVLASFCCQMLPRAQNTCAYLKHDAASDRNHDETRRSSTSSRSKTGNEFSLPDTARILREARIRIPELLAKVHGTAPGQPGDLHNALLSRLSLWATSRQQELPKVCPRPETLAKLKDRSLENLRELAELVRDRARARASRRTNEPTEHRHKPGDISSPFAVPSSNRLLWLSSLEDDEGSEGPLVVPASTVEAHDASFEQYMAGDRFCEVDVDALFADEDFVKFVFLHRPGA